MNIKKLRISSPLYPDSLRNIYNPPKELYYVGNLEILKRPLCAIVGTRRMSGYGEAQAFRFARELSERGVCIVSGLAYGIDKVAHEGALEGVGGTIAVLAQAFPDIQPAAHRSLAEKIIAKGGLLLCEKEPGYAFLKTDYLVRNRIIAGLCMATLVVEAPFKSGARNTAKHALENGRDVLALPGRIIDENSEGTNWLIQQGAKLVTKPQDVAESLRIDWAEKHVRLEGLAGEIFMELKRAPRSPAELGEKFNRVTELYTVLGELELRGLIRFTKDLRYAVSSG